MKISKELGWGRIILAASLVLLLVYVGGKRYVAKDLIKARERITQLEIELRNTQSEVESDKTEKAVAVQEAAVLQQANELLRASEHERQDEIASLKADLAFYRRLGSASGSNAGLAIHHVELRQTGSPRVFELVFTLTQNIRWASVIEGDIELSVEGIKDGTAVHLDASQLLPENSGDMRFEFKYFQQLERLINLPEGFEAKHLSLTLAPKDASTNVEQSISWQELFVNNTIPSDSD
jgi:hypothetical protein